MAINYTEDHIKSLDPRDHIRLRPGMYVGKLGDGSSSEDGIYVLLKEVIDNSIDEFIMGNGKKIDVVFENNCINVRDYGRGVPIGKLKDCVSVINTGAKYDSKVFKKSVGLNGVGIKAVNFLSSYFEITSFRDGKKRKLIFNKGILIKDLGEEKSNDKSGTLVKFKPDSEIFELYSWNDSFITGMLENYSYLNKNLLLTFNGAKFFSKNGLIDLLNKNLGEENNLIYPIIHFYDEDVEIAITHVDKANEDYYSFVNGQHTLMGGTHLTAFREGFVNAVRNFTRKQYDASDIKSGIVAAISIRIEEPIFESQTKTKLGSTYMSPNGYSIRSYVGNLIGSKLDNLLRIKKDVAEALVSKIIKSEYERKEIKNIKKLSKNRSKKVKFHNKKLRDCRVHYGTKNKLSDKSTLFITEGDSASGSITKARDVDTQAVFSLRGKPLNSYGMSQKVVYQNEEFHLLQSALGIEDGIENLRYNKIILSTDADVDGMHIRLLVLTFFLQFFPDLVKYGHLFILKTPLFRVRNTKSTRYCYSEEERIKAIKEIKNPEITRFKGLGEISPYEFKEFIGDNMKLSLVSSSNAMDKINNILSFYMGKNTPKRQDYIINNLNLGSAFLKEKVPNTIKKVI